MRAQVLYSAFLTMAFAGCASSTAPGPSAAAPAAPIRLGSPCWQADEAILALAASPDGRILATGDAAGQVRLLDARSGAVLRTFADHARGVRALAVSPDGDLLASVGAANRAVLRRMADGARIGEVEVSEQGYGFYAAAAFSPDGRILAVGSLGTGVVLLDAASGRETARWSVPGFGAYRASSLSWSSDGTKVVCGCADGSVKVLGAFTGRVLRDHRDAKESWNPWFVFAEMVDPSGALAAVRYDGNLDRWDADGAGGTLLADPEMKFPAAALSPAGDRIAVAARDGTLRWLDPAAGTEVGRFQVSRRALLAVAFVGGPDRIAVAGEEGVIRVLDARTGAVLAGPEGHIGPVYSVAASPDGSRVATGGRDGTVRVWDAATGRELECSQFPYDRPVYSVGFSKHDVEVDAGAAYSGGGETEPADTVPGLREALEPGVEVLAVSLSPDGHTAWAARTDGTVVGYDLAALRAATMER